MKIRRGWILSLCAVLLVTVLAGCSAKEKETVIGSGMWPEYTFQSAVDTAVTIVYGTAGEKKRLECLRLKGNFEWRAHIQGTGWTQWTRADGVSTLGTVGRSLRMEAVEMRKI